MMKGEMHMDQGSFEVVGSAVAYEKDLVIYWARGVVPSEELSGIENNQERMTPTLVMSECTR